ncbi:MAG: AAA family ATPase [Oscillospiraceae bacterium]|nr:AAA family ATPase [Oscillospiraceae bacterium]
MQRILTDKLIEWKNDPNRKPLLVQGIGKCGKTYLLREFGANHFVNVLYYNIKESRHIADLFGQTSEPLQIIKHLSILSEKDIIPGDTLIILDDVQACGKVLEALRYFHEQAPQYHIAAAGSYLEVAARHGVAVPSGAVELMSLYPMSFYEFVLAQSPMLAAHLTEGGFNSKAYRTFNKQLSEKFFDYQITGGMPEVVQSWIDTKSIETVDRLQTQIIRGFESDFIELVPSSMRTKMSCILGSIPSQLVKGNRKFMFSKVKKSWRAKDLDDAVHLLVRAGLIYKVEHIEKPSVPLTGAANPTHFKLYMCDAGLLRRLGMFHLFYIGSENTEYSQIKSVIAENIVCCELKRIYAQELYYWSAEKPGKAEVDFIIQDGEFVIPIEVKAGKAGRARSLLQYQMRFAPKKAVLTGIDTDKDDVLPLFGFWNIKEWLKR